MADPIQVAPVILITGHGRDGTTLMWRLLSAAGLRLALEPLLHPDPYWPARYDGLKQPWIEGSQELAKYDRCIVMRRDKMATCYSQWRRTERARGTPAFYLDRYDRIEAELPGELWIEYQDLCARPVYSLCCVRDYLQLDLDPHIALAGWSGVKIPEWADTAQYEQTEIVAADDQAWRSDPAWAKYL